VTNKQYVFPFTFRLFQWVKYTTNSFFLKHLTSEVHLDNDPRDRLDVVGQQGPGGACYL
jgi:hypothetical protein